MAHVEAIAGARVIHVVAAVILNQPVIGGIVDAFEREHRPQVVAFGRVVVDDVENYFDAGLVKRLHHLLEFLNLLAIFSAGGVFVVGRQIADRIVSPIIPQPALEQMSVMNELMDRH